jgi:hypothetical protein
MNLICYWNGRAVWLFPTQTNACYYCCSYCYCYYYYYYYYYHHHNQHQNHQHRHYYSILWQYPLKIRGEVFQFITLTLSHLLLLFLTPFHLHVLS